MALLAGLVVDVDVAGQDHVHVIPRQDVAAAAGDVRHADGVGAHAVADLRRQGRTGAGPRELLGQHRFLRRHGHQGHRRAAAIDLHDLGDIGVGVGRGRIARHLHHRQVLELQLGPVGDGTGRQDHRHALNGHRPHGGSLGLRIGQPGPGDQQRPQAEDCRSSQTRDRSNSHQSPPPDNPAAYRSGATLPASDFGALNTLGKRI